MLARSYSLPFENLLLAFDFLLPASIQMPTFTKPFKQSLKQSQRVSLPFPLPRQVASELLLPASSSILVCLRNDILESL